MPLFNIYIILLIQHNVNIPLTEALAIYCEYFYEKSHFSALTSQQNRDIIGDNETLYAGRRQ